MLKEKQLKIDSLQNLSNFGKTIVNELVTFIHKYLVVLFQKVYCISQIQNEKVLKTIVILQSKSILTTEDKLKIKRMVNRENRI